jgi:hypothetical protein
MGDRRSELRAFRLDPVDLCWQDRAGRTLCGGAHLTDISSSGASIRAQRPLEIGTMVSISYQNQTLIGEVKHCVLRRSGYFLGIEFQAEYRWSPP